MAYKSLVIADDDHDDVELFQEALLEVCPQVKLTRANDGLKLLEILQQIPTPDGIILDINMPFKSGLECLQSIKSNKQLADVPVYILSTSTAKKDINFCMQNGAVKYFQKPSCFNSMLQIVHEICKDDLGRP